MGAEQQRKPAEPALESARAYFDFALDQLKIQVEMMALRVDSALESSARVLLTGDLALAHDVILGDNEIDGMFVSLSERCYDLLGRQSPVASDLRLVVSVLSVIQDLERTGDLCLRIVKLAPDHHLLALNRDTFSILQGMARTATELFRLAIKAFSSQDLRLAHSLEQRDDAMDAYNARLTEAIFAMDGPGAVPQAVQTMLAGRALERIADHSVMVGERLRYLLTGDLGSLSKQIGP
ncbi:MAG: phosphate signaling complex protein PhoU [Actinomycetota bacterium]